MSICGGAFRVIGGPDAGLYYRHSDHLGSTSVLSDANRIKVQGSEVVCVPFGDIRLGDVSDLTDFGFTGQRLAPPARLAFRWQTLRGHLNIMLREL